jgi:hypothetical protein
MFWYHHCHYHEAYGWMSQMLDRAAPRPSLARGRTLWGRAAIGWEMYRTQDAMPALEEVLSIARQLADDALAASALVIQVVIALYEREDADRAEVLLDQIAPERIGSMELAFRGCAARLKGETERAAALYQEARDRARGYDLYPVYFSATYAGWLELDRGRLTAALECGREAIDASRQLGHTLGQLEGIRIHACVAASSGDHERAVRLFAACDRLTVDLRYVYAEEIPRDRERADALLAASSAALGQEAFDAAWEAGRALSLEATVAYALAGASPVTTGEDRV